MTHPAHERSQGRLFDREAEGTEQVALEGGFHLAILLHMRNNVRFASE
jgi:hypothetical protein